MTPIQTVARRLLFMGAAAAVVVGCTSERESAADSAGALARSGSTADVTTPVGPDADEVIKLAGKYDFVNPTSPVKAAHPVGSANNRGVPQADKPTMTIAIAVKKQDESVPAGEEILALVISDKPYPGLGVYKDSNFVWRDRKSADSTEWKVWMVATQNRHTSLLSRSSDPFSDMPSAEPRLVVQTDSSSVHPLSDLFTFGTCLSDPVCRPSGHCGYQM